MKKVFKWTGFVVTGIVAVALIVYSWLYFASERVLNREFAVAEPAVPVIPTDAASIAEGYRVAQLAGCQHCHGVKLNGALVEDIPNLARIVAPNISVALPAYSDAQLVTVLRRGVKPDRHGVLFMPSEMFRHLGDADLARLIAYLRTVPATAEGVQEKSAVRLIGRLILANGDYQPAALAIEKLPPAVTTFDANDPVSRGRYLAMNMCSECHAQDLKGLAPLHSPSLAVAKGYTAEQFARFMHDGTAVGGRELKLMSETARVRFSNFTADEVSAVLAFLQTL